MAEKETSEVRKEEIPLSCKPEGSQLWQFSILTVAIVMLVLEFRDKRDQRDSGGVKRNE